MPDREVKTVQDQIYFQYAKIIAKRSFSCRDGMEAKKKCYGFIKTKFRELQSGAINWSDITREDWQLVESDKECIYCGSDKNLSREHLVPKSLAINDRCGACDAVQSIHNQVWACRECNSKKSTLGLYRFYKKLMPKEPKYFDFLPLLAEKKYLKTIYQCHECAGTLAKGDLDGDGEITVMDIDWIVGKFAG